ISRKLAVGEWVSCKTTVLPQNIIQQHFQQCGDDWKNLYLNSTIIRELTARKRQAYQVRFDKIENVIVDVLAAPEALSDNSEVAWKKKKSRIW
ncbi:779_t:CDS:2, partial [Gigaspora rosea]